MASDEKNQKWKQFTEEQLQAIERRREEKKQRGREALRPDPKGNYGIMCPACTKPNAPTATFCTGCSFPCIEWDLEKLPDNIFLELVKGKDIGTTVYYRDDSFIVFDDKFGVSDNHLDIIPTKVIDDITALTAKDIPTLERMYQLGLEEFRRRNIRIFQHDSDIKLEQMVTAGYNHPVSVKHLHLHFVLPPFRHEKVFQYPRWHPHSKVISDLRTFGYVRNYQQFPDDAAGKAEYDRAIANHRVCLQKLKKLQDEEEKEASKREEDKQEEKQQGQSMNGSSKSTLEKPNHAETENDKSPRTTEKLAKRRQEAEIDGHKKHDRTPRGQHVIE